MSGETQPVETTREGIAEAFNRWLADYNANPKAFEAIEVAGADYGERCASHLLRLLGAAEGKCSQ